MRSVALANQKGGVGKTTTAIHLAHGIAITGQKVALLDMDPQGNATVAVHSMAAQGANLALAAECWAGDSRARECHGGFWMITPEASQMQAGRAPNREAMLAALVETGFDWLIVDCPPRMDAWGWSGVRMCRHVLVPVQAEFFSIHGLSLMLNTLEAGRLEEPDTCSLLGVLVTMVDWRDQLCREVVQDLREHLGDRVLRSMILRDSSLVEAASHGKTVFDYLPASRAALCYGELVMEMSDG